MYDRLGVCGRFGCPDDRGSIPSAAASTGKDVVGDHPYGLGCDRDYGLFMVRDHKGGH